jgi:hypothetical protein
MHSKLRFLFIPVLWLSCNYAGDAGYAQQKRPATFLPKPARNMELRDIAAVELPAGYQRLEADSNSFSFFLRHTRLKKDKTVYHYDGSIKPNQSAQYAVLDISVPRNGLQQCADAVMRLRAEYLYGQQLFSAISFTDNEGKTYRFAAPYTRAHFDSYLQTVFGFCGTASLSKQLKPVTQFENIEPGNVLIRGGFPGHAVIVMEVAENAKSERIYLLAQSYMPAQDIHLLVNPSNEDGSPWYEANAQQHVYTPEYHFLTSELKQW